MSLVLRTNISDIILPEVQAGDHQHHQVPLLPSEHYAAGLISLLQRRGTLLLVLTNVGYEGSICLHPTT